MAEKKLIARIGADISEFQRKMQTVSKDMKTAGQKMQKIGGGMASVGKTMMAGVTLPLLAAGGASLKLSSDFETGLNKVSTIADTTKKPIGEFKKEIMDLSSQTGESATGLSEALYQTISATNDTENAMGYVGIAAKAAKGGFTDTETAVDGLTSVMNAYGMEGEESMQTVADMMLKTQNMGKTTMGELSNSLYNVIPTASSLGVGFEEVSAAMATMTSQGTPTSVATTQLRQMMVELSKEGGKTSETFKKISGKSFSEFIKQGGSVQEALGMMEEHASNNDLALKDMFGSVEAGNAAMQLTGEGAKKFDESLKGMENATGSVDEAFGKMSKGNGEAMKRAFNDLKLAAITLGDTMAPIISKIAKVVSKLAKKFGNLSPGVKKFIVIFGGILAIVGPIIAAIGIFIMAIGGIATALGVTAAAVASTIGIVIAVIAAVVAIGILLYKNWDTIKVKAVEIWGAIKDFFIATWNSIKSVASSVWNGIRNITIAVWNGIKAFFSVVWSGIKNIFITYINIYKAIIKGAWNVIKTITMAVFNGIKAFFKAVWNGIKIIISTVINVIRKIIETVFNTIKSFIQRVFTGIKILAGSVWEGIKTVIINPVLWVKDKVMQSFNMVKSGISNTFNRIKSIAGSVWEGIKNKITSPIQSAKDKVLGIIDSIKSAFKNMLIKIPKPKIPKISVSMSKKSFLGLSVPVPNFDLSWHKTGGMFSGPSVIGVGEQAGVKEAVIPMSGQHMKPFAEEIANQMGGGNGVTINVENMQVRNDQDIEKIAQGLYNLQQRKARSGGMSFGI